jgi:hypothetical protein
MPDLQRRCMQPPQIGYICGTDCQQVSCDVCSVDPGCDGFAYHLSNASPTLVAIGPVGEQLPLIDDGTDLLVVRACSSDIEEQKTVIAAAEAFLAIAAPRWFSPASRARAVTHSFAALRR